MKVEQIEPPENVERGSNHHYWGMVGMGLEVQCKELVHGISQVLQC